MVCTATVFRGLWSVVKFDQCQEFMVVMSAGPKRPGRGPSSWSRGNDGSRHVLRDWERDHCAQRGFPQCCTRCVAWLLRAQPQPPECRPHTTGWVWVDGEYRGKPAARPNRLDVRPVSLHLVERLPRSSPHRLPQSTLVPRPFGRSSRTATNSVRELRPNGLGTSVDCGRRCGLDLGSRSTRWSETGPHVESGWV